MKLLAYFVGRKGSTAEPSNPVTTTMVTTTTTTAEEGSGRLPEFVSLDRRHRRSLGFYF